MENALADRGGQPGGEAGGVVTPVVRGLRLLEYIAQGGSTGNLSEVGRLIDVNRVTVTRLLATLEQEGMIERLPSGGHQVSLRFLALAAATLGHHDFISVVRRYAQQICSALGVSVYYTVPSGYDMVYVLREMPPAGLISHITLGSRVPAWQVAPGKAVLAYYADETLETLYGAESQQVIPGFHRWMHDINTIRQVGYAWSFSGLEPGINACAAAIVNGQHEAVGALSVVGPERVFNENASLQLLAQNAVCEAAQALSKLKETDGAS